MEEEYNSPQDSRLGSREESRSESTGSPMMIDLSARSGGRPTGSSRRAIRMQEAWDAEQTARIKEEQMAAAWAKEQREIEMFNLDRTIKARTLESSTEKKRFDMSMEAITESQVDSAFKILNMNRGEPDAAQRSVDMMIEYGLGQAFNDPRVKSALDRLGSLNKQDNDVSMVREQREQQRRLMNVESEARQAGASEKEIESARRIDPNGNVYVDEAALMRVRDMAKRSEKQEGAETKEEKKSITEKINSAEKELLKIKSRVAAAQKRVDARPTVRDFKTELDAANIEQGIFEDEINRLNRLRGGETEADAAEPQVEEQPQKELSQQDQVAINWANANPDDPRAKRIKDKLGVQ
jgi:hypothetical protein